MLRIEDFGELAYGGLVTGANYMDQKRMASGTLANKDVWKKFEFWAYLVPGVGSIAASYMGWMPRQSVWIDKISTGFVYDFPRFCKGLYDSLKPGATTSSGVVREAQKMISAHRQLPAAVPAARSFSPEYNKAAVY